MDASAFAAPTAPACASRDSLTHPRSGGSGARSTRPAAVRTRVRSLALLGATLIGVASLAGCKTDTGANPGLIDPSLPYSKIIVGPDDLQAALRFDEPVVIRGDDGFIRQVEVTVRAATNEPLKVDFRPYFFDAQGATLRPEVSWKTEFLDPRVPFRALLLPPGRNAVDYEVQFRWSR